jgi:hypothetical protein
MSVTASRTTMSMPDAAAPWMMGGAAETDGMVSVEAGDDGRGDVGAPGAVDAGVVSAGVAGPDMVGAAADDTIGVDPSVALDRTAVVNWAAAGVGPAEHPASSSARTAATTSAAAVRVGGGWVTAAPGVDTQRRIHRE